MKLHSTFCHRPFIFFYLIILSGCFSSQQDIYKISATEDFQSIQVDGFVQPYIDNDRKAIAINAAKFKNQYGAAIYTFNGSAGKYNLHLHTLAELDGESKYRIAINGKLIEGVKTNPQIFGTGQPDYTPATHIWKNIQLKKGDAIRIEFSSETNGKIPEGNITAYSRGRFTGIVLTKSTSSSPTPTSVNQWINLDENENYTARHECSFVQAGEHFILFGGRESAPKLDMYDFKNNTWTTGATAPKEFNHFQATFYEGFVWVIGAFKTNNFPKEIPEENVWLYLPPTGQWIKGPEIPKERRRGGAGLVIHDDKFYLLGGNTIGHDGGYVNWLDEYDPLQNTWTILEGASEARDHFHASVFDDILYAVGGRRSGGPGGVFAPLIKPVDTYNFKTKKWSQLAEPLPTPRAAASIAVFQNELYVMGGETSEAMGTPALKLVEAYNPMTKNWSRKADMNHPRHGTQAIQSGEGIFIASGSPVIAGGRQHHMEVYNKNFPKSFSIKNSKLEAPSKISFEKNSTQKIVLKNVGGNTGSFISSAKILGNPNFKILKNPALKLMKANGQLEILIEQVTTTTENARLEILYNGNQRLEIELVTKGS